MVPQLHITKLRLNFNELRAPMVCFDSIIILFVQIDAVHMLDDFVQAEYICISLRCLSHAHSEFETLCLPLNIAKFLPFIIYLFTSNMDSFFTFFGGFKIMFFRVMLLQNLLQTQNEFETLCLPFNVAKLLPIIVYWFAGNTVLFSLFFQVLKIHYLSRCVIRY